jgi:hypothetical protein
MSAIIQRDRSPNSTLVKNDGAWKNLGASPYNNRLEQSARGQHLLCSGGSKRVGLTAKQLLVPSGPYAPHAGLRPCSQLNRALYRRKIRSMKVSLYLYNHVSDKNEAMYVYGDKKGHS